MKYVGLYKDPQDIATKANVDAVASRVSTNESDIDGLQTSVGNIQDALSSKQDAIVGAASTITNSNLTANRALISNGSGKVAVSAVTSTELGYLDGVTSNIQTQLNGKLSTAPVTSVNGQTGAVTVKSVEIVMQAAQPTGQATGDFWYQTTT